MKLKPLHPVLLALALAACASDANRSVESVKTPTIRTTQLAYDIRFNGDGLSEEQARALHEYLASVRIAYGDRIAIDDPVAIGADARRAAIAGVVARHGLLVEEAPASSGAQLAPGVTRIVITRSRASIPDCPDWSRSSNPEVEAAAMSNFGCATHGNLAEMVADPNDLVTGKAYEGADGHSITKAMDAFRRRVPTGSQEGGGGMSAGSGAASGNR